MDIASPRRQNLPVFCRRRLSWATLSLSVLSLGSFSPELLTAQTGHSYGDQKQRLADLHIQPLLEAWQKTSGAVGGVIALVDQGQVLMLQGFGLADTQQGIAVDPHSTLFQVGELVRPMTTTAVLRATEQGLLSLEEDLSKWENLDFLELGPFGNLTLEQLLLHTAGFDQRVIASRAARIDQLMPLAGYLRHRMPPRVRFPGQISIPSSHGYALAGRVLEIATGRTFAQSLEALVFGPLNMSSSAVDPRASVGDVPAVGYRQRGEQPAAVAPDYPQTIPASFLLTTAADMAKWLQAILGGESVAGPRFLSPPNIDLLLGRQFGHHASLPGRTLAFKEGSQFSPPELFLASRGRGFSSIVLILPQRRVGLFAAFNSELDLWNLVYPILDTFESRAADRQTPTTLVAANPTASFSGYWQDAAVSLATPEKLLSLIRQSRLERLYDGSYRWHARKYLPVGPDVLVEEEGPGRICFLGDPRQPRFAATDSLVLAKLDWYASKPVQATLWVLFATLFLIAGWPRPPLPRTLSDLNPRDTFSPRWPWTAARFAATLHFLFIASLAIGLAGASRWKTPDLLHGVPIILFAVLTLPLLGAASSLVATAGLARAWRSPYWTRRQRWSLTLLIGVLLLFLPFLENWNLLGFRL